MCFTAFRKNNSNGVKPNGKIKMKKFYKILTEIVLLIFGIALSTFTVCALSDNMLNEATDEIYTEQYKISGAEKLIESVPKDALKILRKIGVESAEWKNFLNFSPSKIFDEILNISKEKFYSLFATLIPIISIIIISSIIMNLKNSYTNKQMSHVMNSVCCMCLSISIITPISKCINASAMAIQSASNFTLCLVPIFSTVMIASGRPISATSYQALLLAAGQIISDFSGNFLIPFLNMLLGVSLISSISSKLKLEDFCKSIYKVIKTVLKFISSTFTGILVTQHIVTSSADKISTGTIKLTIDSCVPIVGGALSDAFSTIQDCIKLLKSGIGAFGIIAGGAIFLPIVIECFIWIIFLNLTMNVCDIFDIKKLKKIFKSIENIVSINLAIIFCVIMILIVSVFILIIIGR